jgi:hypothetical protein
MLDSLKEELSLLKEIDKLFEIIEKTEEKISHISIIEEADKKLFEKNKNKIKNYIWKIENNILEVAFVGVEKAGKSTFANAFIGKEILPSKRERATYIPTEVRYAPNGKVEVYFYTEEEFLKIFRNMLRDVAYPNWENATLENVTIEGFKKHFKNLERENKALFEKHQNRLERDILEILEKKDEIKKFLIGAKKIFQEEDIENYKKFIIDPNLSRAVKRVIIYSSKLKGLENIIIYDLPGFNSPTFTHQSYTIEYLKKADAIVFVREADKPSLNGPEVDILQKTKEEDGVPIKDKLFFFLNKVDVLEKREEIENIKENFIKELKTYNLYFDSSRIFIGSAKAYFERDKKETSWVWKNLHRLGLTDDGIDNIKKSLVEYNQKVRRKLLKKRVNKFLETDVKTLLQKIREKTDYIDKNLDVIAISLEEIKKLFFAIREKIRPNVEALINQIKQEIEEGKPLTHELKEKISHNIEYPNEEIIRRIINNIKSEDYTVGNLLPSAFNKKVREYLKKDIREKFAKTVLSTIEHKIKQVEERFIKLTLETFKEVAEIEDIKTLEENFRKFISQELAEYSFKRSGLKALIERFSGDLIDLTMIPLTDIDREEKFREALRDFLSLAAYNENFDLSQPLIENPMIYTLLTHQDKNSIFSNIKKVLDILKNELTGEIISLLPYGKLIQIIWEGRQKGLKIGDIVEEIEKSAKKLKNNKNKKENIEEDKVALTLDFIRKIRESLKQPRNYEEVEKEIKKDLEILKELLSGAVLRAIHAEKAYTVAVVNYGNAFKGLFDSEKFFDFLKNNRDLLIGSKYQQLEEWVKYKPIIEEVKTTTDNILKKL